MTRFVGNDVTRKIPFHGFALNGNFLTAACATPCRIRHNVSHDCMRTDSAEVIVANIVGFTTSARRTKLQLMITSYFGTSNKGNFFHGRLDLKSEALLKRAKLSQTCQTVALFKCVHCRSVIAFETDPLVLKLQGSLSSCDEWQEERHKFAYLRVKNSSFARFARAFFNFLHFTVLLARCT